jgi:hypothetical protein
MVVTLALSAVMLALFTGGILQTYRSANWIEAGTVNQSRLYNVFQRLDKEIRYASVVSTPGVVGGDIYVE